MTQRFDCTDAAERARGLEAAERALRFGELVVLPTDTVYGLAADAFSASAVDGLLAAKKRGRDMPVPVLVGAWSTLDGLVDVLPPAADALRKAFWPGGLTLVVRHAASLIWDLGDAFGTVAVRMPLHPVAIDLLTRTGPLAVSSANTSGAPRPHALRAPPAPLAFPSANPSAPPPAATCDEAVEQLADLVSVYLDGGP